MTTSILKLSGDSIRKRIEKIVKEHATEEAKQQFEQEKKWRKENEVNNKRREKKTRRAVKDQTPILLRLRSAGRQQLWDFVKGNRKEVYQNEYCRRNNTPCWLWQAHRGSPLTIKQGYGYINLVGLGKAALMVTHLALWTRQNTIKPSRRDHTSHLCHTPGCYNPDHLYPEHRTQNANRNGCLAFRDDNCLESDCAHEPRCIVAFKANEERVPDKSTVLAEIDDNALESRKRPRESIESAGKKKAKIDKSEVDIDLTSD